MIRRTGLRCAPKNIVRRQSNPWWEKEIFEFFSPLGHQRKKNKRSESTPSLRSCTVEKVNSKYKKSRNKKNVCRMVCMIRSSTERESSRNTTSRLKKKGRTLKAFNTRCAALRLSYLRAKFSEERLKEKVFEETQKKERVTRRPQGGSTRECTGCSVEATCQIWRQEGVADALV